MPSTAVGVLMLLINGSICFQVRKVDMLEGVTILRSEKVKDELVLDGNDIELVSRSAALINQVCVVFMLCTAFMLWFRPGKSSPYPITQ